MSLTFLRSRNVLSFQFTWNCECVWDVEIVTKLDDLPLNLEILSSVLYSRLGQCGSNFKVFGQIYLKWLQDTYVLNATDFPGFNFKWLIGAKSVNYITSFACKCPVRNRSCFCNKVKNTSLTVQSGIHCKLNYNWHALVIMP